MAHEISDQTKFRASLGVGASIVGAIFMAGFFMSQYLAKLDNHFQQLEASLTHIDESLSYKISNAELAAWTRALDDDNRDVQRIGGKTGLSVPVPEFSRPLTK